MYALDGALSRYPLLHGFLARRELAQDFPAVTTRPHTAGWPSSHLSQAPCLCPRLIRFRASVAASVFCVGPQPEETQDPQHTAHAQIRPTGKTLTLIPSVNTSAGGTRWCCLGLNGFRELQHTGATGMAHQPRKLTVAHWHSRKQCAASQKPVPQHCGPWMTSFSP